MGVIMKNGINYTGSLVRDGGGGLPGVGYTGSDLILRNAQGDISSVWYIDSNGDWVEYKTGEGGGHSFGMLIPTATSIINNSFSISVEE